jgi:preprotein translocase subunit YajC
MAMLFPFAIMFVIFYLLVFRPQAKERRAHQNMLKQLKKHDEVVTAGGILGTVLNVKPDTITLRVDDNVKVEVEKSSIARLLKAKPEVVEAVVMTAEKRG